MFEIININKKFAQKKVLSNVSFRVESGTICGLLGLNGAGKSTLMKIIASLVFKESGEIKHNGIELKKDSNNISLGYMIESPAFYKDLSGVSNLKILSSLYNGVKDERVDQVLSDVGLDDLKNTQVSNYSLGMKQRLYFAYSILNNPKILILDEPFNGIDPVTSRLFKDLIFRLAKQGCTIIVSSHVISDIQEICDKVVIIDKGVVVYDNSLSKNENLEKLFLSKITSNGLAQ